MLAQLMVTGGGSNGVEFRRRIVPLVALCVVVGCAVLPTVATAAAKPKVGYLAASDVSTTGATIEVPINPEGTETSWEISLECQNAQRNSESCEPLTVGPQRQQGVLAAGFGTETVTDTVTGLQPDYLYKYTAIANNPAGKEGYVGDGFITCASQGDCASQPFLIGISWWNIEGAQREANEAPRLEEEREAKAKEEAERPVKEAAARTAHEREVREAGERAGREAAERERLAKEQSAKQAAAARCHVPSLKGDSLAAARSALSKAHCKLGKVSKSRGHHKKLVVAGQGAKSGKTLADGSTVAVRLIQQEAHGPTKK
jgi:hypothetical protein